MNRQHLLSSILFSLLFSLTAYAQQGLKADYFNGINFDEFIASRIDDKIDFYWNETPPLPGLHPHVCSVRWTGFLTAPETGDYTFTARVDDGIRVWVGGVQVIDDWNLNDVGSFWGEVRLEAGKRYELKVEYFNALVEAEVTLLWKLPSKKGYFNYLDKPAEVIDAGYFTHKVEHHKPLIAQSSLYLEPGVTEPVPPTPKAATPKPQRPRLQSPPATVSLDTLERYIPKNIEFEQAESTILSQSFSGLDNLAEFLLRNPGYRLKIEGHTDIAGDPLKNLQLSERRAYAVAAYLVKKGVGSDRLEAKGYGSSRPLVKSTGRTYHPENRRVAFVLMNNE